MNKKLTFALIFTLFYILNIPAQEVHLKIQNIKNSNGLLAIGVFDSEESFKSEKAKIYLQYSKAPMKNNEMFIVLNLTPGTYGISILDDENSDGKMNWKYLAIPREGFGFADYNHNGLKKPRFQNFSFTLLPHEKKTMIVKMRYL